MEEQKQKKWFRKWYFMLVCGTIWAGFFALPKAVLETWVIPGTIIIILLGIVLILFHLIIAEISLSLPGEQTLIGMANYVLPKSIARIVSFLITGYLFLCLIAYIILWWGFISLFLGTLQIPLNPIRATFLFVCIIWFFQRKEDGILRKINVTFGLVLLWCIGAVFIGGLLGENSISSIPNNRSNWHIAYGISLLALNGMISIPLLYNATWKSAIKMRSVILGAWLSATLICLFFCFSVLSISGEHTSYDSILGLSINTPLWGYVGSILWLVAITSSHIAAWVHLQKIIIKDFWAQKSMARTLVALSPFIAFLYFNPNIIDILWIAWGIIWSLLTIFIVFINIRLHRSGQKIKIVSMVEYDQVRSKILIVICIIGIVAQLLSLLR